MGGGGWWGLVINPVPDTVIHNQEECYKSGNSIHGAEGLYPHQTPSPSPVWRDEPPELLSLKISRAYIQEPKRLYRTEMLLLQGSHAESLNLGFSTKAAAWKTPKLCMKKIYLLILKFCQCSRGPLGLSPTMECHFCTLPLPCYCQWVNAFPAYFHCVTKAGEHTSALHYSQGVSWSWVPPCLVKASRHILALCVLSLH